MTQQGESRLKNWVKKDLRKLIYLALDEKKISDARTTTELAMKVLGEEQGSPFPQRIADEPPPRKFRPPKFNVYNGWSNLADHVRYYTQVMAYWIFNDVVICRIPRKFRGFIAQMVCQVA